jgi:phage terminase large subunit-like protein
MAPRPNKNLPSLSEMLESVADELYSQVESVYSYTPHPKQKIFHSSEAEEKLLIGGNRSGKTVSNVVECIWRLTKTHPFRPDLNAIKEPIRGRIVTVSLKEGLQKIVLPMFKKWMPKKYLINRSWDRSYNKEERTLYLADGSFIEFMTYEQDLEKFAGTSRHFVSFDEEPPMLIWQECLMRLIDTDGDWWISMTPVEGLTWIFDMIYKPWEEGKRPETLVVKVSMHDNPHLTTRGKEKILKNVTDDEDRQAREEGSFVEVKGLVYKDFSEQLHVRPAFTLKKDMKIWTSLDTGWRHPAAWLWHAVLPTGHIVTFHEIVESERTIESLADEVLEWEAENIISKGLQIYARTGDPAMKQVREHTGTSVIGEYAKRGVYIGVEGVPSGTGSVDIGVTKMTTYLQTLVKGVPLWSCYNTPVLVKQMKGLRWEKYESKTMDQKKPLKTTIDKKSDDAPDSLRYFITTQQELTPAVIAGLRTERPEVPSSYYDGFADKPANDYQRYSGSITYQLEN